MLRLERLKKYGPKSEKLSAGQIELLELEPGVHAQEARNSEDGLSYKFSRRIKACSYIIQGASAAISIFLPVFRVRQFTNKPEIMLMLRARIAVLKAKERRP